MRRRPSVHESSFFFRSVRVSLRTFCQGISSGHQAGFISWGRTKARRGGGRGREEKQNKHEKEDEGTEV